MSKAVKKKKTLEELLEEALVPEEEQPYEVPENWVWVYSMYLAKWGSGGTPSRRFPEYFNGNIPWIKTGDLRDTYIEDVEEYITEEGLKKSSAKLFPKDSLAIAMYGATIGKLGILSFEAATNQACAVAIPYKNTSTKFLFYYFLFQRQNLINLGKGGAQPNISQTILKKYPCPLPPINEQKRIVYKVENLLNKIDEAKQLIKEAKETIDIRREAILDKAMRGELTSNWRKENPDVEPAEILLKKIENERKSNRKKTADTTKITKIPYELPKGWKWVRLSQILDVNPPKEKLDLPDNQICSFVPMASVSDVTGKIEKVEERYFSTVKKGYTFFKNGDIIFAKITPCMENGKSAIVEGMKNGFGFGSTEFFVLRVSEHVNKKLIHFLIRSKRFRAEAKNVMSGAVGQQRVPKNFIEEYLFPLPPKAEQEKIVSILDSIFDNEDEIIEILSLESQLEILKKSILFKAFRGELGTNDPQEESALEILKEILREKLK